MIETEIRKLLDKAEVCYAADVVQGVQILINRVAERDAWLESGHARDGKLRDIIERVTATLGRAGIQCELSAIDKGVQQLVDERDHARIGWALGLAQAISSHPIPAEIRHERMVDAAKILFGEDEALQLMQRTFTAYVTNATEFAASRGRCRCARLPKPHSYIPSACTGDRPQ